MDCICNFKPNQGFPKECDKVRADERKERATALSMSDWVQKSTAKMEKRKKGVDEEGEERLYPA